MQAILFDRNIYNTKEARKWLKKSNYKPIKRVHKTEKYLRYRISEPSNYEKLRTMNTKKGIKFIIGYSKSKS